MSVVDAVTARGMAQRISAALATIQQNFFDHNALTSILKMRNQVKWGGSHKEFDWYIRKAPDAANNPTFGLGGNLAVRTFEELNPANQAKLPYCWLERTYGVSDRTIEGNRHASGRQKVYDVLKEQLTIAQISLYNTLAPAIWTGAGGADTPSGIVKTIGTAAESGGATVASAGQTYAGRTLNTAAITGFNVNRSTMGWDDLQFAPSVVEIDAVPGIGAAAWSTNWFDALAWIVDYMSVTSDVSGTGTPIKPDLCIMNVDPYTMVKQHLADASTSYNTPVGNEKLLIAGWANIQFDTLLLIRDTAVPADDDNASGAGLERVFCLDSKQIHICTTHTKAEGIVKNEFDAKNPLISGAIGVLKCNLNYMVHSPTAVGCILGCND